MGGAAVRRGAAGAAMTFVAPKSVWWLLVPCGDGYIGAWTCVCSLVARLRLDHLAAPIESWRAAGKGESTEPALDHGHHLRRGAAQKPSTRHASRLKTMRPEPGTNPEWDARVLSWQQKRDDITP